MQSLKELTARILIALTYKNMTKKELAERIGIDKDTMYKKLKHPESFTLDEIVKMEKVLKTYLMEVSNG